MKIEKMRRVGLWLTLIGLLVGVFYIIFCIISFYVIPEKAKTEYDKYYEQVKSEMECIKIETKAVCSNVLEKFNTNANTFEMNYSFYQEDNNITVWETYYDKEIQYKKDNTYDGIYYEFSYKGTQKEFNYLVVGNGTTSNNNEAFNFEKITDECLQEFTECKIENLPIEFLEQLEWLTWVVKILLVLSLGSIIFVVSLSLSCKEQDENIEDKKSSIGLK